MESFLQKGKSYCLFGNLDFAFQNSPLLPTLSKIFPIISLTTEACCETVKTAFQLHDKIFLGMKNFVQSDLGPFSVLRSVCFFFSIGYAKDHGYQ